MPTLHKFVLAATLIALTGCHTDRQTTPGHDLPVTSSRSVALPGATDAADAPRSPSVTESAAATLTLYRDPATGVSFRYPTVWRPSQGSVLQAPEFSSLAGPPRMTEEFLPKGNYYEPTVLRSLLFSYTAKHGLDATVCAAIPGKSSAGSGASAQVNYNGVPYEEARGGDAAMCTHVQSTIDSTLHNGECLVFERDFVTSCPYVKSKTEPRPLTDAETAALYRHLDAIMQSVQLQ